MLELARRRSTDAREECWHVYYGDVRVGTIAIRSGNPHDEDPNQGVEEADQEAPQGGGRPEGNADADRGQKAGKGSDRQEDGVEAAAQVGLAEPQDPGLTFFQMAKGSSE